MLKTRANEIKVVLDEMFPLFANGSGSENENKKRQYAEILKSMSVEEVRAVLQFCLMKQNFVPTLYEIKTAITQIAEAAAGYHVPTADEALAEVFTAAAKDSKKPRFSHPAIDYAVSIIGWNNILCMPSGEAEFLRAHWRRVYETYLSRAESEKAAKNVLRHMPQNGEGVLHNAIKQLFSAKVVALPSAEEVREPP